MARENFNRVMEGVFRHEGGFVDHPRDPGGATNMGITIGTLSAWRGRSVSPDDVRALTKSEAMQIYKRNYWDKVRGDDLPAGLDYVAMDGAVNSGPRRGAQWLQRALGVKDDGVIGPQTVAAARGADAASVINKALDKRMAFLRGLRTFDTFGRGWTRRVSEVRSEALGMARIRGPIIPQTNAAEPVAPAPAPKLSWLADLIQKLLRLK